jgi:hypothetical protein
MTVNKSSTATPRVGRRLHPDNRVAEQRPRPVHDDRRDQVLRPEEERGLTSRRMGRHVQSGSRQLAIQRRPEDSESAN